MRIIAATWEKGASFKLIPVLSGCPYMEIVYDPTSQTLVVISNRIKRGFQMVPRLDDAGNRLPLPGRNAEGYKQQRVEYDPTTSTT